MTTFRDFLSKDTINEAKQFTINLDSFLSKDELTDVAKDAKRKFKVIFKNIVDGEPKVRFTTFDVTGKKGDLIKYLTAEDGYDMAMYDAEDEFPELFK